MVAGFPAGREERYDVLLDKIRAQSSTSRVAASWSPGAVCPGTGQVVATGSQREGAETSAETSPRSVARLL